MMMMMAAVTSERRLHLQTHTKQTVVSRRIWGGPSPINKTIYRRHQSPLQTAKRERPPDAELPTTRRCPSFTLCTYLSTSPSPSLHPCPVSGKALFLSRQNQQPQGGKWIKKEEGEREMWEGRKKTAALNCCETLKHTGGVGERNRPKSLKTRRVQLGPSALSLSLCHQY